MRTNSKAAAHAGLPEDLQRLSVERVVRTRDGDAFGKVLVMGSVSWCPWIVFHTAPWLLEKVVAASSTTLIRNLYAGLAGPEQLSTRRAYTLQHRLPETPSFAVATIHGHVLWWRLFARCANVVPR